jgi:hypothetical protein
MEVQEIELPEVQERLCLHFDRLSFKLILQTGKFDPL